MEKGLEKKVNSILERNSRVEDDKAWETSKTRRILILGFTYLVTAYVFQLIGIPDPYLNALIPTLAFFVSTLSLPFLKIFWVKNFYTK